MDQLNIENANLKPYLHHQEEVKSLVLQMDEAKMTLQEIADYLNSEKFLNRRNKLWTMNDVSLFRTQVLKLEPRQKFKNSYKPNFRNPSPKGEVQTQSDGPSLIGIVKKMMGKPKTFTDAEVEFLLRNIK